MTTASCFIMLSTAAGNTPPNEFKIVSAGPLAHGNEALQFDAQAAEAVMADCLARGAERVIEASRDGSLGPGAPLLSIGGAGRFRPEIRDGELWATHVRWAAWAADVLRRKERRFISLTFALSDGRITRLLWLALTEPSAPRGLEALLAGPLRCGGASSWESAARMSLTESQRRFCVETGCSALDLIASGRTVRRPD